MDVSNVISNDFQKISSGGSSVPPSLSGLISPSSSALSVTTPSAEGLTNDPSYSTPYNFLEYMEGLLASVGAESEVARQYNANQAQIARDFNASEAEKARFFNASEAQIARDFNASEAEKARIFSKAEAAAAREYNSLEAEKARIYNASMANTAYQRAVTDLKAAGLNPILAATGLSAYTATSPNASTSSAQSFQSSGSAASGSAASASPASTSPAGGDTLSDIISSIGSLVGSSGSIISSIAKLLGKDTTEIAKTFKIYNYK